LANRDERCPFLPAAKRHATVQTENRLLFRAKDVDEEEAVEMKGVTILAGAVTAGVWLYLTFGSAGAPRA
jgi:hypothetical protein